VPSNKELKLTKPSIMELRSLTPVLGGPNAPAAGRSDGAEPVTPSSRATLRSAGYMAVWSALAWLLWRAIALVSRNQYPAVDATALVLLLAGCGGLGVLGRLKRRPSWEVSVAVFVTALLVLTHIFRYYVLDYFSGPPSFWESFRETGIMNAPYAAFLSLWPLIGWFTTARVLRGLQERSALGGERGRPTKG
jgi:hypothetical protein